MSQLSGLASQAERVLVVANRTADSDELLQALRERAARGPARVERVTGLPVTHVVAARAAGAHHEPEPIAA